MWIRRTFALAAGLVLASTAAAYALQAAEGSYERGLTLYRQRNFRAAITEFDQVLEVEPNRADVLYLKGYCQYMLKEFSESVETFGKAFEADPLLDPRTIYRKAGASSGS